MSVFNSKVDKSLINGMEYDQFIIKLIDDQTVEFRLSCVSKYKYSGNVLNLTQNLIDVLDSVDIKNIKCPQISISIPKENKYIDCQNILFDCDEIYISPNFEFEENKFKIGLDNIKINANNIAIRDESFDEFVIFIERNDINITQVILREKPFNIWRDKYEEDDILSFVHPKEILVTKNPTGYKKLLKDGIKHVENLHEIILKHTDCTSTITFDHYKAWDKYMITKNEEDLIRVLMTDDRGYFFGKKNRGVAYGGF